MLLHVSDEEMEVQGGRVIHVSLLSYQAAEGRGMDKNELRLCKQAVEGRD